MLGQLICFEHERYGFLRSFFFLKKEMESEISSADGNQINYRLQEQLDAHDQKIEELFKSVRDSNEIISDLEEAIEIRDESNEELKAKLKLKSQLADRLAEELKTKTKQFALTTSTLQNKIISQAQTIKELEKTIQTSEHACQAIDTVADLVKEIFQQSKATS